jgi:hypothetical protein
MRYLSEGAEDRKDGVSYAHGTETKSRVVGVWHLMGYLSEGAENRKRWRLILLSQCDVARYHVFLLLTYAIVTQVHSI